MVDCGGSGLPGGLEDEDEDEDEDAARAADRRLEFSALTSSWSAAMRMSSTSTWPFLWA